MTTQIGLIRVIMQNVPIEQPPMGLEAAMRNELRHMTAPRLCWLLVAIAEEVKSRGIEVSRQ